MSQDLCQESYITKKARKEKGFILVSTLLATGLLLGFLGLYYSTTSHDIIASYYSKSMTSGFYAAEAGLNLRAENIRAIFKGYNAPSGVAPGKTDPCTPGNMGSGTYGCVDYNYNKRTTSTYVTPDPSNPVILVIPPGELYQNLNAQEYRYVTTSFVNNSRHQLEANLELHFRTRLVPLFQFAAFYDKDLEILPGPPMVLTGPVHTNGDLYLNAQNRLSIAGQVSTGKDLYRGRKDTIGECTSKTVEVKDPVNYKSIIPTCSSRIKLDSTSVKNWNGMIKSNVVPVEVPSPEELDPNDSAIYWKKADLRLSLIMNSTDAPVAIQVWSSGRINQNAATTTLNACPGSTDTGRAVAIDSIYNYREAKWINLMDVDLQGLLNCLYSSNWFGSSTQLSDSSEGGLVFHFTVDGPKSNNNANSYGVRLRNGAKIGSSNAAAPAVKGLTVISDQAIYLMGNYNSINKIPAAVIADSLNVLSSSWSDSNSNKSMSYRTAANTTINAAFLAGTDSTGATEGTGGWGGAYNGGLENYPRFHENWSGKTLTYRGSFVSLNVARHVQGQWGAQSYSPPNRDWNYDISFNNVANLPPLTPRFVYLKQELFVRDFNQVDSSL